jgi:hypothetical protein
MNEALIEDLTANFPLKYIGSYTTEQVMEYVVGRPRLEKTYEESKCCFAEVKVGSDSHYCSGCFQMIRPTQC